MNKFIHRFTVVYFSGIVLVRMMAMPISLLDFNLHKDFIAVKFCENRLNPEMHCAGSCFLKKRLTMANDNHDSRDQKGNGKIIGVDFFESAEGLSSGTPEVVSVNNPLFRLQSIIAPFIGNIFHPPIA